MQHFATPSGQGLGFRAPSSGFKAWALGVFVHAARAAGSVRLIDFIAISTVNPDPTKPQPLNPKQHESKSFAPKR